MSSNTLNLIDPMSHNLFQIVKDTTTQMIHLTAILRSILQAMNCKSKQQTFCWDSVDIYKQSLLYELAETQHLIDYAGAKSTLMII